MSAGGLRERKNERTRLAIERAAVELALAQGFEHTTVDQIAERADVSPRTVFVRYPHKEAIIFGDDAATTERFRAWIEGPVDELLERLIDFVRSSIEIDREHADFKRLRLRAMLTDPELRQGLRGRLDRAEQLIADGLSEELGLPLDDPGPRVFAAAVSGLFLSMAERGLAHPDAFDPIHDCQRGFAFLHAGLKSLRPPAASTSSMPATNETVKESNHRK